mmetsp:Transcript_7044/g.21511  ORF Transcript_7044/g.21511 Transcript_7044/m.21511 type:complete len:207 (+) Transcript_7044:865-1485(+)
MAHRRHDLEDLLARRRLPTHVLRLQTRAQRRRHDPQLRRPPVPPRGRSDPGRRPQGDARPRSLVRPRRQQASLRGRGHRLEAEQTGHHGLPEIIQLHRPRPRLYQHGGRRTCRRKVSVHDVLARQGTWRRAHRRRPSLPPRRHRRQDPERSRQTPSPLLPIRVAPPGYRQIHLHLRWHSHCHAGRWLDCLQLDNNLRHCQQSAGLR